MPTTDSTLDEILSLAASLERSSEHPLASALVAEAQKRGLPISEARSFRSHTGKGVTGEINQQNIVVGTLALLREQGVTLPNTVPHLRTPTNSALFVAKATHLAAGNEGFVRKSARQATFAK